MTDFSMEPLAEDALLLRFGNGIDAAINARVHEVAQALRAATLPGVTDIAPAYATLLVRFDPCACWNKNKLPHERLAGILHTLFPGSSAKTLDPGLRRDDEQKADSSQSANTRTIEIPVCYGGESGSDLDAVARHSNLSQGEVIVRHTAADYIVAMLGFAPGFPYLLGLDPALHVPRRADPRTHVPAGSVAIGGAQTGIYPRELPGGWHLIGRTPLSLFDPRRDPACLLAPGDHVHFRAIAADESAALAERSA